MGTGSCFGSILVRLLTSLVKGPWLLTGLQTILVVQETCLPSQTLPVTHILSYTHTHILYILLADMVLYTFTITALIIIIALFVLHFSKEVTKYLTEQEKTYKKMCTNRPTKQTNGKIK